MSPPKPRRRSISAAAKPAAPPPTMTMRPDPLFFGASSSLLPRTTMRPPRSSTVQQGRGPSAGVVPWAVDSVVDKKPLGERPMIMRALTADGVDRTVAADKQDLIAADMPGEHRAFGKLRRGNALCEIGPARLIVVRHV